MDDSLPRSTGRTRDSYRAPMADLSSIVTHTVGIGQLIDSREWSSPRTLRPGLLAGRRVRSRREVILG